MRSVRRLVPAVMVATATVGCSGGGDSSTPDTTTLDPTTISAPNTTVAVQDVVDEEPVVDDGPLAEFCPPRLVVQTESLPHPRHGALYALLASNPEIDATGQRVSAPLRRATGEIEDVTLELRSGGPAVGFRSPIELQAGGGEPIHLAETSFSELSSVDAPEALAVVALGGGNDDMIMWDPATYPSVSSIGDLGTAGTEVRHVVGSQFIEYLVAVGALERAQLTERGGTEIAGFIASGGEVARQGDAVLDPALLPSIAAWGREISFEVGSEVGWLDVDRMLAGDGSLTDECLGRLVPVIQASIAAYTAAPGPVDELLATLRTLLNPLDRVSASVLDDAVRRAVDDGRWADAFDGAPGRVDLDRLETFADDLRDRLGTEVRAVDDVVSMRYTVDQPG